MALGMSGATRTRLLKDALGRALRNPPASGTRSFMIEGLSCTVDWRPTPNSDLHQVRVSLRRDGRRLDHATSLTDLSQLPRACEQVLLQFDREDAGQGAAMRATAGRR